MSLPTPHLIHVRRWSVGVTQDPHGNPVGAHGEPEELWVHSIAPGPTVEDVQAGRSTVASDLTVLAPAGTSLDARDLVIVGGAEYHADGGSRDWTRGPWVNPVAGVQLELVRKDG